jgi:two-component system phosphate regulon sensor histidine kinase PhoR
MWRGGIEKQMKAYRSPVFGRLFWGAFMSSIFVLASVAVIVRGALTPAGLVALGIAAALLSWLFAFLLSRPVDREISRSREFAGSLLYEPADLAGADNLDELGALDLSLRRMAGQAHSLLERTNEEAARREAILGAMVEGVLAVDDKMHVTFCNQALARMAGGRTPATGTPVIELVRDAQFLETLEEVVRTGKPATWHLHIPGVDGHSFEVQAAPLISGDSSGAVAILHDISELERLENVRRDFVANVSHEFRTPLAAITGYAETLLDGALEDPGNNRRFLEIIRSNAIRLNSIAADLLTLSDLQRSNAVQATELVPIGDAIESALSTIAAEASLRGVTLHRGPITNLAVPGSRYQLEQALVNLLANAVKFNQPEGKVSVETREEKGQISILISDTGVGIPSKDLPRIFERFYRVDKARSRQVGGTGLGLSIVKHIIERMNGHVSATSQLGKGSVFTIVFAISSPL